MPAEKKWSEHKVAEKEHWYSCRHPSSKERADATTKYQAQHSHESKRAAAESRQALRARLSPQEQLVMLDSRLGPGVGAKKERARLEKLIEEAK